MERQHVAVEARGTVLASGQQRLRAPAASQVGRRIEGLGDRDAHSLVRERLRGAGRGAEPGWARSKLLRCSRLRLDSEGPSGLPARQSGDERDAQAQGARDAGARIHGGSSHLLPIAPRGSGAPIDPTVWGCYFASVLGSARKLTPGEVAILETFAVPRYLTLFGEAALEMLLVGDEARVAHLGCRTGYPARQLLERIDSCSVVGLDSSLAAVELARNKARTLPNAVLEYHVATAYPTVLPADGFSHALALHPTCSEQERRALLAEMTRALYWGGQALIALPMRGSFQALADLLREYALAADDIDLDNALEEELGARPTVESLSEEMEAAGLDDVDVTVRATTLEFEGGRAFVEDPVTRLFVVPELCAYIGIELSPRALDHVALAIDKYWAGRPFPLEVRVGAASARKATGRSR